MITSNAQPLVHHVESNGSGLSVLELAPENKATDTLVMHHGLRDGAHALLPVATVLIRHFHVLMPELREHGQSSASDTYGNFDFVMDLHEVITALAGKRLAVWGHSLGGHIVRKYAAIFPGRVDPFRTRRKLQVACCAKIPDSIALRQRTWCRISSNLLPITSNGPSTPGRAASCRCSPR